MDPQPCASCDGAAHPVVCEHPDVVSLGTGCFDPGLDAVVFPCLGVSPCEFFCLAGVEVAADPFAPVASFERVDANGGGAVEVEVNQAEHVSFFKFFLVRVRLIDKRYVFPPFKQFVEQVCSFGPNGFFHLVGH